VSKITSSKGDEEMKESTFIGGGGLKIFTRSWQPEGETRGVVVIIPGLNSHINNWIDTHVHVTQTRSAAL
jgi:alpha-beta hydrolase superfamily lysophospholipase